MYEVFIYSLFVYCDKLLKDLNQCICGFYFYISFNCFTTLCSRSFSHITMQKISVIWVVFSLIRITQFLLFILTFPWAPPASQFFGLIFSQFLYLITQKSEYELRELRTKFQSLQFSLKWVKWHFLGLSCFLEFVCCACICW